MGLCVCGVCVCVWGGGSVSNEESDQMTCAPGCDLSCLPQRSWLSAETPDNDGELPVTLNIMEVCD